MVNMFLEVQADLEMSSILPLAKFRLAYRLRPKKSLTRPLKLQLKHNPHGEQ
jgi:hypothetical protein